MVILHLIMTHNQVWHDGIRSSLGPDTNHQRQRQLRSAERKALQVMVVVVVVTDDVLLWCVIFLHHIHQLSKMKVMVVVLQRTPLPRCMRFTRNWRNRNHDTRQSSTNMVLCTHSTRRSTTGSSWLFCSWKWRWLVQWSSSSLVLQCNFCTRLSSCPSTCWSFWRVHHSPPITRIGLVLLSSLCWCSILWQVFPW